MKNPLSWLGCLSLSLLFVLTSARAEIAQDQPMGSLDLGVHNPVYCLTHKNLGVRGYMYEEPAISFIAQTGALHFDLKARFADCVRKGDGVAWRFVEAEDYYRFMVTRNSSWTFGLHHSDYLPAESPWYTSSLDIPLEKLLSTRQRIQFQEGKLVYLTLRLLNDSGRNADFESYFYTEILLDGAHKEVVKVLKFQFITR